jgi:hypothetical protein
MRAFRILALVVFFAVGIPFGLAAGNAFVGLYCSYGANSVLCR